MSNLANLDDKHSTEVGVVLYRDTTQAVGNKTSVSEAKTPRIIEFPYKPRIASTGLSVVVDSRDIIPNETVANSQMWKDFEALFGAWANRDDLDDDWLDKLRGEWEERLTDIYESDEE